MRLFVLLVGLTACSIGGTDPELRCAASTVPDTIIAIGSSHSLGVGSTAPSLKACSVTFRTLNPEVAEFEGVALQGVSFGNGAIEFTTGVRVDTAWIGVVPEGTFAMFRDPNHSLDTAAFEVVSSDLAARSFLFSSGDPDWTFGWGYDGFVDWAPDGGRLLVGIAGGIFVVEAGHARVRIPQLPELDILQYGAYHPQTDASGEWIYFVGMPTDFSQSQLWRTRWDGSAAHAIASESSYGVHDGFPSASPDGQRIVYAGELPHPAWVGIGVGTLRLLEVATGTVTETGLTGVSPRWSPTNGSEFAYVDDQRHLRLFDTVTGEDSPVVSDGTQYAPWFDWSPDGRFLLATRYREPGWGSGGPDTGGLEVIEVATGVHVFYPHTNSLIHPSWQPT